MHDAIQHFRRHLLAARRLTEGKARLDFPAEHLLIALERFPAGAVEAEIGVELDHGRAPSRKWGDWGSCGFPLHDGEAGRQVSRQPAGLSRGEAEPLPVEWKNLRPLGVAFRRA
jgi:hypothetical protein